MILSSLIKQKYGSDVKVFIHSSVVTSKEFGEIVDLLKSGQAAYLFSTGLTELNNYHKFQDSHISGNVNLLHDMHKQGKLKVSDCSEYDLTRYNKRITSLPRENRLVIYGQKRAYTDFAVHCAERTPIDLILLVRMKDTFLIANSNQLRPILMKTEYNTYWNFNVYTYQDALKKGTVMYFGDKKTPFQLGDNISMLTGEGEVYRTSINGCLCKIYKKGVLERGLTDKLSYVIQRTKLTDKAAWPLHMVYNRNNQPIGFLMRTAEGELLANFMYRVNEENWLSDVCTVGANICEAICLLHAQNILVGDISSKDILVDKRLNVIFIDADSFQYDYYPCPGLMFEYKYKDLQPNMLKLRLRPFFFEYFSLSVLLYELFTCGHFPNEVLRSMDEIEFGDDYDNDMKTFDYRNMRFPFAVNGHSDKATPATVRCWERIPQNIQQLFVDEFNYNRIVSPAEWQAALSQHIAGSRQNSSGFRLFGGRK